MEIKDVLLIGLSIMAGTLLGKHIHGRLGRPKDGDANVRIGIVPYNTVESNIRIPASAIYDDSKKDAGEGNKKPL